MKVCRSDQCIGYCEEFSVTHTIQEIGFMSSILLELGGNCGGNCAGAQDRNTVPGITRYRYVGNTYTTVVQNIH